MEKLDEIIKFAIDNEMEAAKFYHDLQEKVDNQAAKEMLLSFEKMELAHADILKTMDISKIENYNQPKIADLKLSDYMVEPEVHEKTTFQDILVLAMKREQTAAALYNDLANQTTNITVQNMFMKLATEEQKHKLQLETMYDDTVNYEN